VALTRHFVGVGRVATGYVAAEAAVQADAPGPRVAIPEVYTDRD
jgi:hypothetical protein